MSTSKITGIIPTKTGLILVSFENNKKCLISLEQYKTAKELGLPLPKVGDEINQKDSVNPVSGEVSADWVNIW